MRRGLFTLCVVGCASGAPQSAPPGDDPGQTDEVTCGDEATWDADEAACLCDNGEVEGDMGCPAVECVADEDCDDGDPCTGDEVCGDDGTCGAGEPVQCDVDRVCAADAGEAVCVCLDGTVDVAGECLEACPIPWAPVLAELATRDVLQFAYEGPGEIEVATGRPGTTIDDAVFVTGDEVRVDALRGDVHVWARPTGDGCIVDEIFDHVYRVYPTYSGAYGESGSTGVTLDDPAIVGWATGASDFSYGDGVDATWQVPERALGPAQGTSTDVAVLGRGGWMTLTFDAPLRDLEGPDFAVFENGFDDRFLEFGYVEVSSNGTQFVRFDSGAITETALGPFDLSEASHVTGLAGKYRAGVGTTFDLALLRYQPEVRSGVVDLSQITHVRVVDVVGDGLDIDSFGRVIFDPYPTMGSAGFDLDAVGVMHQGTP
jgi:hypothetical protein